MSYPAESRITKFPKYLRVDFGSSDGFELSATYRSFLDLCLGMRLNCALLQAGDNEPSGHRQLREMLSAMARTAAIPPDFKLALVPSTPAIRAVYRETQHALRAIGLNAWVFDTVADAEEWLEGRLSGGLMAS